MPGDDRRKIEKGAASGVDAVIMDLEDGVALSSKAAARAVTAASLRDLDYGRTERLVRLNPVGGQLWLDDFNATVSARPDGYVLPKCETAAQVQAVAAQLAETEAAHGWADGGIRLLAIIETAMGVLNLREIATSSPRLDALIFGAEDLAGDMGATRTPDGWEAFYARSAVVLHARAFGLQAVDTPYIRLEDTEGLREQTRLARTMGYTGKLAVHPRQVEPIQTVFTPTREEIEQAQRLIKASSTHQDAGVGVFDLDGKMVDMAMVRAAESVLERARAAGIPNL